MSDYFRQNSIVNKDFQANSNWIILTNIEQGIKKKIEQNSVLLKELGIKINYGIKTGFNEAFIIDNEIRSQLIKKSSKSAEIIRPIIRGRDVQKYQALWAKKYLISTFPSLNIDIDEYPDIKDYLLSFGIERIEQTGKSHIVNGKKILSRKKTSNKWFETQDQIGYWSDFEQPKIIWKRIGSVLRFAYDDSSFYCLDSTCFAVGNDLKYLTGILNSCAIRNQLLKNSPKTGTGDVITSVQAIEPLLIPNANSDEKRQITTLVDECIQNINLQKSTDHIEKKIDEIVFNILNLNESERLYLLQSSAESSFTSSALSDSD